MKDRVGRSVAVRVVRSLRGRCEPGLEWETSTVKTLLDSGCELSMGVRRRKVVRERESKKSIHLRLKRHGVCVYKCRSGVSVWN